MRRAMRLVALVLCVLVAGPACADEEHLTLSGARFDIQIDGGLAGAKANLLAWITNSADTVARFYGQFPSKAVALKLVGLPGGGVHGGLTTNGSGAAITVRVGSAVTRDELASDWVLVHEMVHLALPDFDRRHEWLAEGLATYVEGIARAQAGRRDVTDVWAEYKHSMPQGLPKDGEGGLDQTHSWGRTYWGGALFCLLADVSIRERSKNRYGLRDALVAILRATGGYAPPPEQRELTVDETFHIGDEAIHSTELADLYASMKDTPVRPDLVRLWERLGVRGEGAGITFDDTAPLAFVRKGMTNGNSSAP